MANWIARAVKKPGQLHKDLGVAKGKKIPASKLDAAAKKGGKVGMRARFAENMKSVRKKTVGAVEYAKNKLKGMK